MSDYNPILVYGGLRCGTTVFRLMLDAHPQLSNPGEIDYLFDYLYLPRNGTEWAYDIEALLLDRGFAMSGLSLPAWGERNAQPDGKYMLEHFMRQLRSRGPGKMLLTVHRNLHKIVALFPGARFIHLVRDPRDVSRSCIGMGWAGTTYYGVDAWIQTESAWDKEKITLEAEKIIELRYEDLISAPASSLSEVCDFLGVPFEDSMLRYHEATTYAPPDRNLIEQWRSELTRRNLELIEGKLGSLITSRGYTPSGFTAQKPNIAEKFWLLLRNKSYVWRFSFNRYGFFLVMSEKISRLLGLVRLNKVACQKINKIAQRHLK